MNTANTKKLFDDFTRLFRGRDLPITQNLMQFGFECGDGWFTLVYKLSADIIEHAKATDLEPIAVQVKEKNGGLRFYVHDADEHILDLCDEADRKSVV